MAQSRPAGCSEIIGFGIGNGAETMDRPGLLQQLLFADRAFRWIDLLGLRRRRGCGHRRRQQCQRAEHNVKVGCENLHGVPSEPHLSVIRYEVTVSR
jgi:hypothetical protein